MTWFRRFKDLPPIREANDVIRALDHLGDLAQRAANGEVPTTVEIERTRRLFSSGNPLADATAGRDTPRPSPRE